MQLPKIEESKGKASLNEKADKRKPEQASKVALPELSLPKQKEALHESKSSNTRKVNFASTIPKQADLLQKAAETAPSLKNQIATENHVSRNKVVQGKEGKIDTIMGVVKNQKESLALKNVTVEPAP